MLKYTRLGLSGMLCYSNLIITSFASLIKNTFLKSFLKQYNSGMVQDLCPV